MVANDTLRSCDEIMRRPLEMIFDLSYVDVAVTAKKGEANCLPIFARWVQKGVVTTYM